MREVAVWAACLVLAGGCAAKPSTSDKGMDGDAVIAVNDGIANSTSNAAVSESRRGEAADPKQGVAGTEFGEGESITAAPGLDATGLSTQYASLYESNNPVDELVVKAGPPGLPLIDPCKQYD
ncbi:MAG: hypothetical protein E2O50_04830, partial [Gammaproteobacteria bacterium]